MVFLPIIEEPENSVPTEEPHVNPVVATSKAKQQEKPIRNDQKENETPSVNIQRDTKK